MFEHVDVNYLLATYGYWAIFIGCLLEGETILILGGMAAHQHVLKLLPVIGYASLAGMLGDQLLFWAGRYFGERLLPRLALHSERLSLRPAAMALSNAKGFWGVCRARTGIRLNWRLIGAPDFVVDYICVHELCHLPHPNHSPRFWALVNRHTPHTEAAKHWLKQHGNELFWLDAPR